MHTTYAYAYHLEGIGIWFQSTMLGKSRNKDVIWNTSFTSQMNSHLSTGERISWFGFKWVIPLTVKIMCCFINSYLLLMFYN